MAWHLSQGWGLAAVFQVPNLLARTGHGLAGALERLEGLTGALAVLPTSWAATSIVAAREGRVLTAGGVLAALLGLVALLAAAWVRLLERAPESGGGGSRPRADRPLFAGVLRLLPRTRLGAAAARELRYLLGEPQLRVQWLVTVVLAGALVGAGLLPTGRPPGMLMLAIAGLASLQGLASVNGFGADRGAVWLLLATGRMEAADLAGKNVAGAVLLLPIVAVAGFGLAVGTGGWGYLLPALLLVLGVLGVCYGVGDVASVLAPTPLPERPTNAWAGATGTGCATAVAQGLAFLVAAVVLVPPAVLVLAAAFLSPQWLTSAAALAAAYGLGVWWIGVRSAGRLVPGRGPEVLAALEG